LGAIDRKPGKNGPQVACRSLKSTQIDKKPTYRRVLARQFCVSLPDEAQQTP
jgi:hypothetical protein